MNMRSWPEIVAAVGAAEWWAAAADHCTLRLVTE